MFLGLLQMLSKVVAALPKRGAEAIARHWGWLLAHVIRLRRRYVLATLARSFPEKSAAECRAIYNEVCRQQALNAMDLLRYAGGRQAELAAQFEAVGLENLARAQTAELGALVLMGHFGNYALLALQVPRLFNLPLAIVAKPLRNATLNDQWWELMRKAGITGIPARNAYRASVRALKEKKLVGFMLDQNRPATQGVFVDFFGKPAATTPGLALMSAQTGAAVLPAFVHRLPDGRHRVVVHEPIAPPPDRRPETIREYTARYTRILEDEIRREPAQWLWWHKRWKSRPPAEQPPVAP